MGTTVVDVTEDVVVEVEDGGLRTGGVCVVRAELDAERLSGGEEGKKRELSACFRPVGDAGAAEGAATGAQAALGGAGMNGCTTE